MILPAFHNTAGSGDAYTAYYGVAIALGGWLAFGSDGWMLLLWSTNLIWAYLVTHPRARISRFLLSPIIVVAVVHAGLYFRPPVVFHYWEVPALLIGYYVWIASLLVAAASAWLGSIDARETSLAERSPADPVAGAFLRRST